jgi:hypothetical protein
MANFFPNVNRKEAFSSLLYYKVTTIYATHLINLVSGPIVESESLNMDFFGKCFYEETLNRSYRETNRNLPMGNAFCPLISSLVLYKHFEEKGLNLSDDLIVTGYADDNSLMMTEAGYEKLCSF